MLSQIIADFVADRRVEVTQRLSVTDLSWCDNSTAWHEGKSGLYVRIETCCLSNSLTDIIPDSRVSQPHTLPIRQRKWSRGIGQFIWRYYVWSVQSQRFWFQTEKPEACFQEERHNMTTEKSRLDIEKKTLLSLSNGISKPINILSQDLNLYWLYWQRLLRSAVV